jgi:hypothetical protein
MSDKKLFTETEIEAVWLSYEYLYDQYLKFKRMRTDLSLKPMRIAWVIEKLKTMQKVLHKMIEHSDSGYAGITFKELKP